jgi:hypothetical protein
MEKGFDLEREERRVDEYEMVAIVGSLFAVMFDIILTEYTVFRISREYGIYACAGYIWNWRDYCFL